MLLVEEPSIINPNDAPTLKLKKQFLLRLGPALIHKQTSKRHHVNASPVNPDRVPSRVELYHCRIANLLESCPLSTKVGDINGSAVVRQPSQGCRQKNETIPKKKKIKSLVSALRAYTHVMRTSTFSSAPACARCTRCCCCCC